MAGRKIKLKDQLGRVVRIPSGAPATPSQPAPAPAQPERPSPAATVWKLIREVPANLQKVAKLAGAGFTTRGADGEWHQRSLAQGEGIAVTNGDGVAGDPAIALAELPNAGGGTLQKTARDSYGRVAGTSSANTDDLAEGISNRYFPEAPVDGGRYARCLGGWERIPAPVPAQRTRITSSGDIRVTTANNLRAG